MSKRRALMVLGMHRSGTSALARVLSLRGAELPTHVMAANRGNETGYWEPAPIVEFNDELLDFFGVDWDDPFAPFQVAGGEAAPKKLQLRAGKLLEQEFNGAELFVLKDPRISLLHAFWFQRLAQMKVKACPVVVMRPFAEVAHSLLRRDQANPEASVLLYVAYGLAIAEAVDGQKTSFVTYDQLVNDWRATTDRIAAEQGIKWPRTSAYSDQDVGEFLQPAPSRLPRIALSPTLAGWANAVWDWFRARAEGQDRDAAELAPIRAALAEAALTFAPLLAERRRRLRQEHDGREGVERQASEEHARFDDAQAGLARTAAERDAALVERDRIRAVYEATQAELERTQAAFRDLQATGGSAAQGQHATLLAERDRALASMQSERDRALAQNEAVHAELQRTQRAYADLEQRATTHAGAAGALTSMQGERDRLLALYEGGHGELVQAREAFRQAELQAVRATERLAAQDAQLADLRTALERSDAERIAATTQRESLHAERDRVLALYETAQAELARTQAAFRDADGARAQAATRLAAVEPQLVSLQAERDRLQAQHDAAHAELARAQAAHLALDHDHRELAQHRDSLQAERDRALAQQEATQAELARTQAAYVARDKEYGELALARDALQAERDRALAQADTTQAELVRTQAVFAALESEHREFAQQRDALQVERDALQVERDRLQPLLDTAQAELDRVLALYDAAQAELTRTQAAFRDLDGIHVQAAARLATAEPQLASLQAEHDHALAQLATAQAAHASLDAEHRALAQHRDDLLAERDRALAAAESVQAELVRTQAAYATLDSERGQLATHRDVFQSERDSARADTARVGATLAALRDEHEALRARFESANGELQRLQDERTELHARGARQQSELANALESFRFAEARLAQLATRAQFADTERARADALVAERAELVAERAELVAERTELADARDRLTALQADTVAELQRTQQLYNELHAQATAERDQLQALHADTVAELQRTQALYADLDARAADERTQLQSAYAELEARSTDERAQLQSAYADLEARSTDERTQLQSVYADTTAELQRTQQQFAELDAAMQAERERLLQAANAVGEELARTQQDYAGLQVTHGQVGDRLERLGTELAHVRAERDTYHEQLERLGSELAQVSNERDTHREQLEQLGTDLAQTGAERDTFHEQLGQVHAEYATLQAQATGLAEDGERLRGQVGLLELEREELTARLETLTTQLQTIVGERDELHVHLREISDQLGAELEQGRLQLAGLGQERDDLHARLNALIDEQHRVGDELADVRAQREFLADDLQSTRASLQGAAVSLEELRSARAELLALGDRLRFELEERRAQLRQAHDALNEIHASRSWRITAPLRQVTIAGRRMINASSNFIHRPRRLLSLPAPAPSREEGEGRVIEGHFGERTIVPVTETGADVSRQGIVRAADLLGLPEPTYVRRQHPGLRAFLAAEFGEAAAAAALLRIDRYRLPIDTAEVRGSAKATCTDDEARYWAAALARRVSRRPAGGDAPDVSIVIPVYNQVPFTLACIDSLLALQSRYTFEILIGDDASTDATAAAFALPIEGVTHVRHVQNLGFVRNCNATAERARGRYVVMLNNDTQVLPGWLDELIDVLEGDPQVGMVGSKLIYPDGRMQECGGILWRDGSAWNFGRLDDPRQPEYCYLRDTDYVSGASIALASDLWRKLGGFDEHFVPAYAEDVDLAFRVRAAGLATKVQPLSQLLHFEGVSSGTDLGAGAKAYQVENLRKIHARYRDVLAGHRPNAERPDLEKERSVERRVLFIDHTTLTPNEDAGSLVAFEILQSFRKLGYKVTFVPEDNFAHVGADTRALQRIGIETIYHPAYSRMHQFLAGRHDPFDVIVMHRFGVGDQHLAALKAKWPEAKFVFLACDLHYLREMREAELSGDPATMTKALDTRDRELAVARATDAVMVYSDAERDLLAQEMPGANIVLFPLVHDPVVDRTSPAGRDGVCFVGGYRHAPNADGIIWFAEHAWPMVRARCGDAKLYVAGSQMTDEVRALGDRKGVEIVGFVEDMEAFLAVRRVNIAPLRFGAGVKGKVSAALANGLPTVCTPIAAEGMQLQLGIEVLVGETPTELAERVIDLLESDTRWQALADAGIDYAGRVTSRTAARGRIRTMLHAMGLPAAPEVSA